MKNTMLNYISKTFFITFLVIHIGWGQTMSVIPPSPNAASLGKYGDIPVSYYTGLANTSILIYSISSRDISLPISLSYPQLVQVLSQASLVPKIDSVYN